MIIHWPWVIAAFWGSGTLTLCLEIRRRRQRGQISRFLYVLPLLSLFLAGSIWLTGYQTAVTQEETAVFLPPSYPQPTPATPKLPFPQISAFVATPPSLPTVMPPPEIEPSQTAVIRLSIPALNLSKPVQPIPLENGIWNVADLGSDVGWLETTAVSPEENHAMVFVGHMTYANQNLLEEGAFAHIPNLPYGSAIILETASDSHTFLVDSVRRVSLDDTPLLYQEAANTILLLTCADWNPQAGIYENRLLVRAIREP